jgi:hypothetical protein
MSLNVTKIILQHPGVENNRKAWENDIQPSLQLLFHWPPPLTGFGSFNKYSLESPVKCGKAHMVNCSNASALFGASAGP